MLVVVNEERVPQYLTALHDFSARRGMAFALSLISTGKGRQKVNPILGQQENSHQNMTTKRSSLDNNKQAQSSSASTEFNQIKPTFNPD